MTLTMPQYMVLKPKLITLEGIEGVGKSTSIYFVRDFLRDHQIPIHLTREPGGTLIAEKIRQILIQNSSETIESDCELLLLFAARAQHIYQRIQPALARGEWVVSDRFHDASYAYQGGGRGIPHARIQALETWLQADIKPDLTLLLDAPISIALKRMKHRASPDRFEAEQHDFFERVRKVYLERAADYPQRFRVIDTSVSLKKVQQQINLHLKQFLHEVSA